MSFATNVVPSPVAVRLPAAAILLYSASHVRAATSYTWANVGEDNWATNANWDPGTGHPVAGDTATVANGGTVDVKLSRRLRDPEYRQHGRHHRRAPPLSTGGTLTTTAAATIGSGLGSTATVNMDGGTWLANAGFNMGMASSSVAFTLSGGTLTSGGTNITWGSGSPSTVFTQSGGTFSVSTTR